jgi:hypothetical protein
MAFTNRQHQQHQQHQCYPAVSPYQALQETSDWQCMDEECRINPGDVRVWPYEGDVDSVTPPTPYYESDEIDEIDEIDFEERHQHHLDTAQSIQHIVTFPVAITNHYNPNDPLRYFLDKREITQEEYDKWKLVVQEPAVIVVHHPESHSSSRPRPRIDYGPGYNSSSDSEDEICGTSGTTTPTTSTPTMILTEIGYGYATIADQPGKLYDSWNLNPDPTDNRQYTKLASSPMFRMSQFVQIGYEDDAELTRSYTLRDSFTLKLIWERYETRSSAFYTLQTFWDYNSLKIYEILQDFVQRKCYLLNYAKSSSPTPPLYHTTPIEMLENTFETIGRMCRCIAEDFNTPSVVAYVKEFISLLYLEIEFMELVDAY